MVLLIKIGMLYSHRIITIIGANMSEFLKVLLNVRSLRANLRDLPLEQLEEAQEKLEQIYIERLESTEKERSEQAEHQRKLAEFSEMLKQAGVDPRDLVSGSTHSVSANAGNKVKRAPRPPKYKYQEDGQEKTWTGQGRMPKAIAEQIAQGKSLEQFAI